MESGRNTVDLRPHLRGAWLHQYLARGAFAPHHVRAVQRTIVLAVRSRTGAPSAVLRRSARPCRERLTSVPWATTRSCAWPAARTDTRATQADRTWQKYPPP